MMGNTHHRVLDVVSVEQTDALGNAKTLGRPASTAPRVSRPDGTWSVIAATGVETLGKSLKSGLGGLGVVVTDCPITRAASSE